MKASVSDWKGLQNILWLLLLLAFCLYLPTLFHDAFADDDIYLAFMNRFLREAPWNDLYQLFLKPQNPWEFLPLRDFTYWLDFRLYGDENGGFHVTNLVWYAVSGVALFWLFRELVLLNKPAWARRANVLSLSGALLFIAHPAHVEVAAWIASRKDLVAGTLFFLSAALLVRTIRCGWCWRDVVLAALLLFAACFGKASAMAGLLFVGVLICFAGGKESPVSRARKLGALLLFGALVACAYVIHLKVGESTGIRIENHPGVFVMFERASRILATQIGILIFPYPLHFYYDVYQLSNWHWVVTCAATVLLVVSLVVLRRRCALWALGVVLALTPLTVYLQLMPFTTWSLASERFVFISVAGLALVLIDLFGRMSSPAKIGGLLLLIVVPSAVVVWLRVGEWEGGGPSLLNREYELQPNFHNVIRDRIGFTLLPEKRYEEAAALARQLPRPYAADALLSLVAAEQVFRRMSDAKSSVSVERFAEFQLDFCTAVSKLRLATHNGYAHIPDEPDVSYNNILRTLDNALKYKYGDAKILCVKERAVENSATAAR